MPDERIVAGMRAQLAHRAERLRDGERPLGWKVGFGAPAAMEKFAIDRPLVGYLLDSGQLTDGAEVAIGAWTAPALELEIAAHLGADVAPGAGREEVRAAIRGLSAALELADVTPPPEDVEAILAGNIFHRHVILGELRAGEPAAAAGIGGRVVCDGELAAATEDPAALTGELVEVVRSTHETLEAAGEGLRAGDVVITGSIVAPLPVAPGQAWTGELDGLGVLSVRLVP